MSSTLWKTKTVVKSVSRILPHVPSAGTTHYARAAALLCPLAVFMVLVMATQWAALVGAVVCSLLVQLVAPAPRPGADLACSLAGRAWRTSFLAFLAGFYAAASPSRALDLALMALLLTVLLVDSAHQHILGCSSSMHSLLYIVLAASVSGGAYRRILSYAANKGGAAPPP